MATPCNTYTSRPKSQIAQSQHKLAACKYCLQRLVCFQSQNQVGHMTRMTNPENSLSSSLRTFPSSHGQGQRYALNSEHLLVPPSGETNQRLVGFVSRPPSCHGFRASAGDTNLKELSYFSTRPVDSPVPLRHAATSPFGISPSPARTSKIGASGSADFGHGDVGDRLVGPSGRSDCGGTTAASGCPVIPPSRYLGWWKMDVEDNVSRKTLGK